MERLRVATIQYYIRPVERFDDFAAQVEGLVVTAADYDCRLVVFPEYFTIQLLTLGDLRRPMPEQIRWLAGQRERVVELLSGLARRCGLYLVGGSIPTLDGDRVVNVSTLYGPSGDRGHQAKLHVTRWEREDWNVVDGHRLKVFRTAIGCLAVAVCYDVEFPEIARAAARLGADLLIVPSCTDDRQGFLRVRYCAHARAIENQMYVIQSSTVGSLPMVPAVALNYGQSSILTPSDFPFARDGILAEGVPNQESMVIGELDLRTIHQSRTFGSVLPLNDSARTQELISEPEIVEL